MTTIRNSASFSLSVLILITGAQLLPTTTTTTYTSEYLMDSDEIPEITDRTEEPAVKRFREEKRDIKPLFKFKIKDLLEMDYNKSEDVFRFENYKVSFIMCGGKISDIFRDDIIFCFELNDGTGSIKCFHKFKEDPKTWSNHLDRAPTKIEFCERTFIPEDTCINEETIFNPKLDTTVVGKFQDSTTDILNEVWFWFKNQIIDNQKMHEVGNTIHITGHLLEDETESIRKINVLDFRIVGNELESEDLQLEMEYLRRFVYS